MLDVSYRAIKITVFTTEADRIRIAEVRGIMRVLAILIMIIGFLQHFFFSR